MQLTTFIYTQLYLTNVIWTIAIANLYIYYSSWWLLFVLLQLKVFICNISLGNFCIYSCVWKICRYCFNFQLLFALLRWKALKTFEFDNIHIHYCNSKILLKLLHLPAFVCTSTFFFCMYYCTWQLMYALLPLMTIICCINNIKIMNYIVNKKISLKTALQ